MGCGETMIYTNASIACSVEDCSNPNAVQAVLAEEQHEHRVTFRSGWWIAQHPLRERVDGSLVDCSLNGWLHASSVDGDLPHEGEFRAIMTNDEWSCVDIEQPPEHET